MMRCKWCGRELHYETYLEKKWLCDAMGGGTDWASLCTGHPRGNLPYHELNETSEVALLLLEYSEGDTNTDLNAGTNDPSTGG
jgi:hypothetical protein